MVVHPVLRDHLTRTGASTLNQPADGLPRDTARDGCFSPGSAKKIYADTDKGLAASVDPSGVIGVFSLRAIDR